MLQLKDGTSDPLHKTLRRLEEVSWNFDGSRSRSNFSALHFHPGRFISQLPAVLISLFTEPGQVVLDPFCGSGTTLVECQRMFRRSIGIDINPISILVSKGKTLDLSHHEVSAVLDRFFSSLFKEEDNRDNSPETVQSSKWYSEQVYKSLCKLYGDIENTNSEKEVLLKKFCFSSILLKVSRETRHWGYVCDNTAPKSNPQRDVARELQAAISLIKGAYKERDLAVDAGRIFQPDCLNVSASLLRTVVPENSVDFVVTSPPYFGVVDYAKSQRLSMEWFGYDIENYRLNEIGARSKRHRISAAADFKSELKKVLLGIASVLKPGKPCAIIFGASERRSVGVESLIEMGEASGLIALGEIEREISVQRRFKPSLTTERLFLFKKPLFDQIR